MPLPPGWTCTSWPMSRCRDGSCTFLVNRQVWTAKEKKVSMNNNFLWWLCQESFLTIASMKVYSLNVKILENTTLYMSRCPSNGSLKRVVGISLLYRGFTPGQSEKSLKQMQTSIWKSGRPLEKELSLIWLFKGCFNAALFYLESMIRCLYLAIINHQN